MGEQRGITSTIADRCDVCMAARTSIREGDIYVCEVCLDGDPPVQDAAMDV